MTPAKKTLKVEKVVTLLDTMKDVTLVKLVDFDPPTSVDEALKFLGNSQEKLLKIISKGLEAELQESARKEKSGWRTYKLDEADNPTVEINGEFSGDTVDPEKIRGMVLNFAKMFGYSNIKVKTEADRIKRRKIKEDAEARVRDIIKNDEEMRKAVSQSEDDDKDENVSEIPETTEPTV